MGFSDVMKHCGMELYELHVSNGAFGTVDHGRTVARGNDGVGSCLIDRTTATGTHHGDLRKIGVHLVTLLLAQHIGTIALDVGCAPRHLHAQMVLCDDFHCKMVLFNGDVRMATHGLHQATLYLCASIIGMM